MTGPYWDDQFNVTRGCSHASPGCDHCWARDMHKRFRSEPFEQVTLLPEVLSKPLHRRKPTTYFVCNTSDLYHPSVPFEFIAAVYGVMAACPQHTFLVLTKRPERRAEWFAYAAKRGEQRKRLFEEDDDEWRIRQWCHVEARRKGVDLNADERQNHGGPWPLTNVWEGVTAENQAMADVRIPILLQTPAAHRWVSVEPCIGGVDLDEPRCDVCGEKYDIVGDDGATPFCNEHEQECSYSHWLREGGIDQLVIGGESGPGARPCDLEWIRSIVRQARESGTKCFVKQLGSRAMFDDQIKVDEWEHCRYPSFSSSGSDPSEWPEDLQVRELAWKVGNHDR